MNPNIKRQNKRKENPEVYIKRTNSAKGKMEISRLKAFVEEAFPQGAPLKEILRKENAELSLDLFLARVPIWLQLSKLKNPEGKFDEY
ncbi:MAG: hypothetical protein ABR909_07085 [Candidatus Bathyarchaeia archaeon]